MNRVILCAIMALLTACGHDGTRVQIEKVYVEKRVECPSKEERDRLRNARPKPLRDQVMPTSAVERSAQANAQLGRYEAPGAYADQVEAALDRCQK